MGAGGVESGGGGVAELGDDFAERGDQEHRRLEGGGRELGAAHQGGARLAKPARARRSVGEGGAGPAEPGLAQLARDGRERGPALRERGERLHRVPRDRLPIDVLGRVHGKRIAEHVHEARRHGQALVEAAAERLGEVRGPEAMQRIRERAGLHAEHVEERRLGAQLGPVGVEDAQQVRLAASLRQHRPHRALARRARLEPHELVEPQRDALRLGAQRLVEERAHHRLLVVEVLIQRAHAEAGHTRDAVGRRGTVAVAAQHPLGGLEDRLHRAPRTRLARGLA